MRYGTLKECLDDYSKATELGDGHYFQFVSWSPDRALNPQYDGIPDVEKYGGIHIHPCPDGSGYCVGSITFDGEVQRKVDPRELARWTVHSLDPLSLSPSLLCRGRGSHGFIRDGKWVQA